MLISAVSVSVIYSLTVTEIVSKIINFGITKTQIILRMITEMKLKLFFKNKIIIEIIGKPEWEQKSCHCHMFCQN